MSIQRRLQIMSFLQFFIWGSWLITLGSYMINSLGFSGYEVGLVYGTLGIASLFMPSILGIVADKWIPANRLYVLCHLIGAFALFSAASITSASMMIWVMLLNALVFMPSIPLSYSITYYCLEQHQLDSVTYFPKMRVFGTVGFILAMWIISLLRLELSHLQLYIAGAGALLLAVYALLALPKVPVNKQKVSQGLLNSLGLNAFTLLKQPKMLIFFLFAMLLGAVLQITNTFGNPFLHDFALNPDYRESMVVQYPSILLSLSQISEVVFILFVPFFLKRFGIKGIMLISMLAWVLRFGLFAYGDPSPVGFILLMLSMLVYGCAFDFFNISGSIFVEKSVSAENRNSAQGLFMTVVNGFGAYFGAIMSGLIVDYFTFSGVRDWHSIWLVFACYSLVLAIVFIFAFKDEHKAA